MIKEEIEYRKLIDKLHKAVDGGDYSAINKIASAHCAWAMKKHLL